MKASSNATYASRFSYTGQTYLAEIGLYYYKARLYNPTIGRFMQTDPIGYGDGMNWYAYVHGDPVNSVDPSGLTGEYGPNPDNMEEVVVTGCDPKCQEAREAMKKAMWEAAMNQWMSMYLRQEQTMSYVAVLVGTPTLSNPFGHVALVFTGKGVYSYGTKEKFGSKATQYLANQGIYRGTIIIRVKITSTQEIAMIASLNSASGSKYSLTSNTCATVAGNALRAGGLTDQSLFSAGPSNLPISVQVFAESQPGATSTYVPQGSPVPSDMSQFDPK